MIYLPTYPTLAPEDYDKAWREAGFSKKMITAYLDQELEQEREKDKYEKPKKSTCG